MALRRRLGPAGCEFSTKLSTGAGSGARLFCGIQNLARNIKFYFKFVGVCARTQTRTRRYP
ncbi:hypothetical protein D1Y85_12980 [Paraburkholderia dinghuensis]|uniref:Uncharacterized protein n=1 Tax=Paraburkholderia dinghuensis TaxID=2305225 RepID=A0A3N6PVD0_9BURK|nr:hypothetical protein D1Y85_12980 [Paraburkholderia dinghuensis]